MKITKETVDYVARLARVALTDEEKELFTHQLGEILGYMERLSQVDTTSVEPTSHVVDLYNVMRSDEPGEPLSLKDVLKNAPQSDDEGMIVVPRVIDSQ